MSRTGTGMAAGALKLQIYNNFRGVDFTDENVNESRSPDALNMWKNYKTLGKKIGFNGFEDYKLDLPFRSVNNLDLGNVYTTFYPYIYDFGYIGEFILVLIMAIISQVVFEFTKDTKTMECPSLSILTYSNIVNCLILSFFSNKFYENIISISMLKNIVFWWLFSLFLCKINYKETFKKVKKIIIDKLTINCQ